MSSAPAQNAHQIQQDIQHELITANQLLNQISIQLNTIKEFTSPGGELESTIKHNASIVTTLAKLRHINLDDIPPMVRKNIDMNPTPANQSITQNESEIDHTQ